MPHSFKLCSTTGFSFLGLSTLFNWGGRIPYFFDFWALWQLGYLHSGFMAILYDVKKSLWALYDRQCERLPKLSRYFKEAWHKNPAMIPIVVGRLAAHTPSRLMVPSVPSATARGLAHPKQPVSPGTKTWIWPDKALSDTPDSNQIWSTSLQMEFTAILAL